MKETKAIGKVIKMPCMRRGLCAYSNETVLVTQETLEKISKSIMGVPLVIDHPQALITDENIDLLPVVGRVADMHYDSKDDLWYAHFVVDDQKGIDLLNDGYGISTAWFGDKYGSGGTLNNVGYDRELLEGRYEHLAIVKTPRYEMAVNPIYLNSNCKNIDDMGIIKDDNIITNSNTERSQSMIGKIFKKLVSREEIKTNEGEEIYVNVDGQDIAISAMVTELKLNKKNEEEKKEEKKMANGGDEVDVDGEKISVNELVKRYKAGCGKKNEADSKEEEKKELEKNEADEKKKKELEEEEKKESKKNSIEEEETNKRFEMIKSIHENGMTYELEDNFLSMKERVAMGKKLYGKK